MDPVRLAPAHSSLFAGHGEAGFAAEGGGSSNASYASYGGSAGYGGYAANLSLSAGVGSLADGSGAVRGSVSALDPDEHFRVVIRVRPPLERELNSPNWQNVVTVTDEIQVSLHEVLGEANAGDRASGTAQVVTNHAFTFDHVYDRDCSQPDVYSRTARASVLSTLQGYNATILAYGPTGTGKTYTMEGPRGEKIDGTYGGACGSEMCGGIIPRSMEEIFQHIRHCRGPQSRFLVRASYLQIYNEVISDLLKPDRSHLVIREDRRRGVFVEGLSEWLCRSPSEVRTLMERGSAARATAQTAANDASSRSHAVFIVIIEQSDTVPGMEGESERAAGPPDASDTGAQAGPQQRVRVGRLNLVDLAGSERPRLTGATGQRLEETKKINQSLSALGNVIAALTERRARQHIPYRDSKLTRLLEDSLGGNCRTTMMAMVSPAAEAFAESLSTLKFAHRAKAIRNCAQVNEDVDQRTLLRRYEGELRRLRAELRERNRNVVDKRQLLELEEERRRAEEDRLAAVSALEERSLVLEQEKAQKQQLEERIRQMSSQLLVGGQQVEDTPQFRHAVAEQERIRMEYAVKLTELERERSTIEEDKAQVSRYKQLLLKQRDIMMALTQRLHERDEAIIALQDEIHTRDRRLAELEDHLDRRGAQLLAAERRAALAGGIAAATAAPEGGNGSADGGHTASVAGHPGAAMTAATAAPPEPRYPPENAVFDLHSERPMQLLSASEKVAELMAFLDGMRQENHRLTLELEELQAERASADRVVLEQQRPQERQTPVHDSQVLLQPIVAQPNVAPARHMEFAAGTGAAAEEATMLHRLVAASAASTAPAPLSASVASAPSQWLGLLHPGGEAVAGLSGPVGGSATASGIAAATAAEAMRAAAASQGVGSSMATAGAELLSVAAATTAAATAAGRHIGSPLVHQRDGSVTPEGSLCGSTPRPSSASTRASATSNARGEHRGRRPPSLERGRSDDRPRSSSSRGDKPLTVRQGGAGSVSSSGSVRAASLGSSVGTTSTSLKSSARAGIGAWRGYSDVWPSPAPGAGANMLPTAAPAASGLAPTFAEAFAESFAAMTAPAHSGEPMARESSPWYAGAGAGSSRPSRRTIGASSAARTSAGGGSGSGGSAPPTPHGRHQRVHRDVAAGSLGPSPGPSPSPAPAVRNSFPGGLAACLGSNALGSASTAAAANAAATNGSLRRSVSAGRSSGVGGGLHGPGPVRAPPLPQFANWGAEAGGRPLASLAAGHQSTSQSRALGAWLPSGLSTAVPGSPADSFGQSAVANNMGLPGSATTADALREEAQRSVDALLARRKAELRRSGSVPTAGAGQ